MEIERRVNFWIAIASAAALAFFGTLALFSHLDPSIMRRWTRTAIALDPGAHTLEQEIVEIAKEVGRNEIRGQQLALETARIGRIAEEKRKELHELEQIVAFTVCLRRRSGKSPEAAMRNHRHTQACRDEVLALDERSLRTIVDAEIGR